jgi:hypothetical protein
VKAGLLLAAAIAISLATGCSKEEKKADGSGGGSGLPSALLEGWTKASLTVSAFTADKSGAIGPTCQSGTVSGVDVVWCSFASDTEAKAAEPKGLEWVGGATGTALVSGKQLLAVVDRRAADPSGRTINAVTKAFR